MRNLISLLFIISLIGCSNIDSNVLDEDFSLIQNSDFEDGLNQWGQNGEDIILGKDTTFSGLSSALIKSKPNNVALLYQHLKKPVIALKSEFKVYPVNSSFRQGLQFLSNWDDSPTTSTIWVIQVELRPGSIHCKSLDSTLVVPFELKQNDWNLINIETYDNGEINVFINEIFICSFLNKDPIPIETFMFGNLTLRGHRGTIYYDNFNIMTKTTN